MNTSRLKFLCMRKRSRFCGIMRADLGIVREETVPETLDFDEP